ncbi:MAG: VWA domain-containing protein [candidate division Zixibacteria bacterium]
MRILKFEGWDIILFQIPGWFIFLIGALIIGLMVWYYIKKMPGRSASMRYSDVSLVKTGKKTMRQKFRPLLFWLRLLALAFLIIAMARPQSGTEQRDIDAEGIDIIMALDISGSMEAEDFKPHNRLYVAKEEIGKFIDRRTNDRIGLVVFARNSFTQCPLTLDYGILKSFLEQIDFGMIEDGTAIGMALANSVNRLRESEARSKIIVLLTDGVNNAGEIDPLTAANVAKTMGIKIYTIGAGKPGNAMYPVQTIFGKRYQYLPNEIDEELLTQVADKTGGKYYRARSETELEQIYSEIDQLEKTKIYVHEYTQYEELFFEFVIFGFIILMVEMFLSQTYFRKIP